MAYVIDLRAASDDLVDFLTAAGLLASTDPSKVGVPGVWVKVERLSLDLLAAVGLQTTLYVLARDASHGPVMDSLSATLTALLAALEPVGGPAGDLEVTVVDLPDGAVCPAVAVPFTYAHTTD